MAEPRDIDQLSLFDGPNTALPESKPEEHPLFAPALPPNVFLGTSSWTFEGWKGLVYSRTYRNKQVFTQTSLNEYSSHRLFGTVGIDASYYNPLRPEQLKRYADQLPEGFRCLNKVWDVITLPTFPNHPRYGQNAGKKNPDFLNTELFLDAVLKPNLLHFYEHLGPVVFEFSPMRPGIMPSPNRFAEALDRFFESLPPGPLYSVELRNKELLTANYLRVLKRHKVCHVLNLWSYMPTPRQQMALPDIITGPAIVSRLMISPGARYADRVQQWAPFERIKKPNPEHHNEAIEAIFEGMRRQLPVYTIVNNKVEGCSPLTIKAIAEKVHARITSP